MSPGKHAYPPRPDGGNADGPTPEFIHVCHPELVEGSKSRLWR